MEIMRLETGKTGKILKYIGKDPVFVLFWSFSIELNAENLFRPIEKACVLSIFPE